MHAKSFLVVPGIILGALIGSLGASIGWFAIGRAADFEDQKRRVEALRSLPVQAQAISLDADRAMPDAIGLDRLRMIATHNSYRKRADALRLFFIGLAQPGEPTRLDYAHKPLAEQLEGGVRSFELDLRYHAGRFECAHVPLVDDRSTVPDFSLGLEELALWSERRPGHVPIILLLELKEDYLFLDPAARAIGAAELDDLDATIRASLGARLFSPDELRAGAKDIGTALAARGWPKLGDLRGRVIVVLHPNEAYRITYTEGHPALAGRAMFACPPSGSPDLAFAVVNDPVEGKSEIARLVGAKAIVRTRADGDGSYGSAGLAAALASKAQIISTDFPALYPAPTSYRAELPGGGTLGLLP